MTRISPQLMVGPDIPSEKVRVMLEEGAETVEQAVREAGRTRKEFDPVFGHYWSSRHAYHTGEGCSSGGV